MPTYRTIEPRTDRILKDWILKERLAFDLEASLSVSELQAILPPRCKEQLGEFKPTDNVFRKMSQGFNRVSDVWIELMRFIGVSDFSPEQAILGTVSTFLDSENVRVKLNASYDAPHRKNSIEVLCLNEPTHQGLIRYEGDRLSFPPSIFEAVIDRRLNVYNLYCENLSDLLLIPGISDPQSLLLAENNARLAEEHRGSDEQPELDGLDALSAEDPWMDSPEETIEDIYEPDGSAIHETEPSHDDVREHNELITSLMTDDVEVSDDAIALTPFNVAEAIFGTAQDAYLEEMADDDDDNDDQYMNRLLDSETAGNPIVLDSGYPMLLNEKIAKQMADLRDLNQLTGSSLNEESSDDETVLTSYDGNVGETEIESIDDTDDEAEYDTAELEAARSEEAARDAYLEEMADVRDHNQLIASSDDEEASDDEIALTPYDENAAAAEVESVDDTDKDAEIEAAVDGHGFESDEVDGDIEDFEGNSILN